MPQPQEKDLAARILERAQMAQMTRQLKLGLSKVPTPKSSGLHSRSPSKPKNSYASSASSASSPANSSKRRAAEHLDGEGQAQLQQDHAKTNTARGSPLKKQDISPKRDHSSPLKMATTTMHKTPTKTFAKPKSTTPTNNGPRDKRNDRSNSILVSSHSMTNFLTHHNNNNTTTTTTTNNNNNTENINPRIPSTPGRSSSLSNLNTFVTPKRKMSISYQSKHHATNNNENNINNTNNNAGADLLIYLATSPYTKQNTSSSNNTNQSSTATTTTNRMGHARIPTTPSSSAYMNQHQLNNDDAIRFSNMKPSISSPQSTFKVPQNIMTNSSSMSFNDILLESPSLYMNNNIQSPQRRRIISNNLKQNHDTGLITTIPTTPSRELHNQNINNLLKTPNFNMGDYIHNLFSPSPRVTLNSNNSNNITTNQQNLRRGSINSLTTAALLSSSTQKLNESDEI